MSTELIPTNGAAPAARTYTQEQRELVRNTVAQGATDVELDYFLQYTAAKGLDPFAKEAWFIKSQDYTDKRGRHVKGRVQIMTGIEGFFRIANSHPQYDGVEHEYGPELSVSIGEGKAIKTHEWIESLVYRKDRKRPERRRAYWNEFSQELVTYSGKLSLWAQKPRYMLEKCADAIALRKAFPQELGDLYVAEEMPREYSADEEERRSAAQVESEQRANYIAQRTAKIVEAGDYIIEHGGMRGRKISDASNSAWLESHLAKYRDQIPEAGRAVIEARIAKLRAEHAAKLAAAQAGEFEDGWTPTPEEIAEIEAAELEESEQ